MLNRQHSTEKSLAYLQLTEACQLGGCPICTLMHQSTFRFLDALFYESVTDVGTRMTLWRSRGFCNWHAWFTVRELMGSAQGIAIIYHDLLSQEIEDLQKLLTQQLPRRTSLFPQAIFPPAALERFTRRWRQKTRCPVCIWVQWEERCALEVLCHSLGNPVFLADFSRSAGLCVPHLRQAILVGQSSPHLPRLLEIQCTRYQRLAEELKEFDRKHDYRFAHEPWGSESNSWRRVVEQFVGKREIFGNEVHSASLGSPVSRWPRFLLRLWQWMKKKWSAEASLVEEAIDLGQNNQPAEYPHGEHPYSPPP